jgi:D-aminoacyl-tRNA deacylase
MRVIVQRVKKCSVSIDGKVSSSISSGLLIYLGVRTGDNETDAEYLSERCSTLRIFDDQDGKMNLSVKDVQGEVMVVSQFTLYGNTSKGNRPSYMDAASPEKAEDLYRKFTQNLKKILGEKRVATGVFRAMMDVESINDGPVTLIIESKSKSAN